MAIVGHHIAIGVSMAARPNMTKPCLSATYQCIALLLGQRRSDLHRRVRQQGAAGGFGRVFGIRHGQAQLQASPSMGQ
ncbi:MAG: hypothetical protein WAX89_02030 [Alphaproteobacteria bacterium]